MKRILSLGLSVFMVICMVTLIIPLIFPNPVSAASNNSKTVHQTALNYDISANGSVVGKMILLDDNTFKERIAKAFGPEVAKKVKRVTTSYPSPQGVSAYTAHNGTYWVGYWLNATSSSTNIYDVVSSMYVQYTYVQYPGTSVYDFEWSGIGGVNTSALLQAGVDMRNHTAFTEALPAETTAQEHFSVNVGDTVDTAVYYVSGTEWFVSVYDENNNQAWGNDYYYTAPPFSDGQGHSGNEADWIVETPFTSNPQQQYYIGHFLNGSYGTVSLWGNHWYDSSWTQHNMDYVPANGTLYQESETTLNNESMSPSTITSNSFSVGH
jgi:hypothetical protein